MGRVSRFSGDFSLENGERILVVQSLKVLLDGEENSLLRESAGGVGRGGLELPARLRAGPFLR